MNLDKQIRTEVVDAPEKIDYMEMNFLIKQNLETNTMPYMFDKPFPKNLNVVSGRSSCADLNIDKFELKARSIGAQNTMWIYGADAANLGLELKTTKPSEFKASRDKNKNFNCEPITISYTTKERLTNANIENNTNVAAESIKTDKQCAYLLDQFTEESIARLFDERKLKNHLVNYTQENLEKALNIAKNVVVNKERYKEELLIRNSLVESIEQRNDRFTNIRQNIYLNTNCKNTPVFKEVANSYQKSVANFSKEQKLIFDVAYKMHNTQSCPKGQPHLKLSSEQKATLNNAYSTMIEQIKKDPSLQGSISKTMFEAFAFSERLTHHNFSLEPIFSQEEQKAALNNIHKLDKNREKSESILSEKQQQKYRSKQYQKTIHHEMDL